MRHQASSALGSRWFLASRSPSPAPCPARTGADLDEPVVLYEDGVTSQVPVDDGRAAGVQKAAGHGRGEQAELGQGAPGRRGMGGRRHGQAQALT